MASDPSDLPIEAWLYTRDDESVRVEVHKDAGAWAASVTGPGTEHRLRVFHDQATFDTFRAEHSRELFSKGFGLRATSERRVSEIQTHPIASVVRHERRH